MSFHALAWAAKQRPGNLAAKMVLLGLANFADEHGCSYPSTAALAEFGDMDPKTATAALDRLIALGIIDDSGERAGRTKQIKVYQLNLERLPETEASQKRKPPVFSGKDPQKRGTDTVLKPNTPVISNEMTSPAAENEIVRLKPEHVVEAWNELAGRHGLPVIRKLTANRQKHLRTFVRGNTIDEVRSALDAIERSGFLRGENDRGWRADFDFLLQPKSFAKLIEGAYDH